VSVVAIPAGLSKPLSFTSSHEVLKTQLKDAVLHSSGDEWKRAAAEGPANEIEETSEPGSWPKIWVRSSRHWRPSMGRKTSSWSRPISTSAW